MIDFLINDNVLFFILDSHEWLGAGLDWLLKSIAIIGLTALLVFALRHRLSSSSKHLLWLNSLVCVVLLPVIAALFVIFDTPQPVAANLFTFQVTPASVPVITAVFDRMALLGWLVVGLYLVPAAVLFLRLAVSVTNVLRIPQALEPACDGTQLARLRQLRSKLNISRSVRLGYSRTIGSPLSYGLFTPTIVLPAHAKSWHTEFLDDVLIHELSHIKRLDWITMLFAYLVASLLWINPLAWLALRRLNEEAENSCDSTVLRLKEQDASYAETLFKIAQDIKRDAGSRVFAQLMLDRTTLGIRIHRILENKLARATTHRLFALPLGVLVLAILVTCTSTQLLTTESPRRPPPARDDSRGLILPTVSAVPQYPLRAAYAGIEGWALVEFDVLISGDIAQDSITVVDAEPPEIFNRASMRAASQFKFEPVSGTLPADIKDVQYLFRFALEDENSSNDAINREFLPLNSVTPEFPPEARATGVAGGNVWTVFHVTRAGTVQDIRVNYSSNDVFNAAAIAAAQQLQFRPRSANDEVQGNVRGDTTGLVRAQYLFAFE